LRHLGLKDMVITYQQIQMNRSVIFSTVVLAAAIACSCAGPVPPVPTPLVDGFEGDVKDAILSAHRQAVAQPESGQASGHLGMVLEAHAQYQPAILSYRRAIRLDPDEFSWRYYLALTLQQLSQQEDALRAITEALHKRPDYDPAILKKGELLFQLGRIKESGAAYESLLAREPNSAEALYGLAQVKYSEQDFASAEDLYRRACQAYSNFGAAHYGLATANRNLGHEAEAAQNFALARRFSGDRPPAADPLFDRVAELATGSYNQLQQVDELLQKGDLEKAAGLSQEILRRDPDNMGSLLNLLFIARFLNHLDDMVDAWYARAVRINPEVPYIYNHYGAVLLRQGKYDAAVVALRKAIALRPGYSEAHLWLGRAFEQRHLSAEAIEEYRLALAADSSNRGAQIELGRILINLRRDREAIPQLLPALSVDDAQTSFVMVLLGEAYLATSDPAKARQYLEQARGRVSKEGPPQLLAEIEDELSQLPSRP
jgi:tetratricopeptide (TPR) repeat protein